MAEEPAEMRSSTPSEQKSMSPFRRGGHRPSNGSVRSPLDIRCFKFDDDDDDDVLKFHSEKYSFRTSSRELNAASSSKLHLDNDNDANASDTKAVDSDDEDSTSAETNRKASANPFQISATRREEEESRNPDRIVAQRSGNRPLSLRVSGRGFLKLDEKRMTAASVSLNRRVRRSSTSGSSNRSSSRCRRRRRSRTILRCSGCNHRSTCWSCSKPTAKTVVMIIGVVLIACFAMKYLKTRN